MIDPQRALEADIAGLVAQGARVEWIGRECAVLAYGGRVNHVLHAILSLVTFGLWLPVWLLIALSSKPRRVTLTVDAFGQVQSDRPIFVRSGAR